MNRDVLEKYHKAGIPLLRIQKGTKRPIDKTWNENPDEDFNDIIEKFSDDEYNVGGVIGSLIGSDSDHTLVLDFDNQEYFNKLTQDKAFQDVCLKAPVVRTPSGGTHVWIRVSSNTPVNKWTFDYNGEAAGEVLGHRSMAVLPPSEVNDTKSGNGMQKYEMISGDHENIPLVSLRQIQQWFPKHKRNYTKIIDKAFNKDPHSGWPVVKIEAPQPPKAEPGPVGHACQTILNAPDGQINNTVNDMAFFVGRQPGIDVNVARKALQEAVISRVGVPEQKAFGTIERGLEAGVEVGPAIKGSSPMEEDHVIQASINRILDRDIQESKEMDLQYLPRIVQDYVEKAVEGTMLSPTMVTMSLLNTVSVYIGHKAHFNYFEKIRANIWSLIFSGSGNGKSTALNRGSELYNVHDDAIKSEIIHHANILLTQKKDQQAATKDLISALESSLLRYSNRISLDAFYELLCRKENGGGFVIDEFSSFLKNMDEKGYNSGFKNELTSFYNAYYKDTKSTKNGGIVQLNNPYISIIGVSTEEFISDLLTPSDVFSGFLARFLMFSVPTNDAIPPALPSNSRAFNTTTEFAEMKMVVDRIMLTQEDTEMVLNEDAKVWFEDAHNFLWEQQKSEQDPYIQSLMEAFCKRWSPNIIKLSMILQWISKPGSKEIEPDAVQGATSIVSHAVSCTVGLYRGTLGGSREERWCKGILRYIASEDGKVRYNKMRLNRPLKPYNQGKDPLGREYDEILDNLVSTNEINITKESDKKASWVISLGAGS